MNEPIYISKAEKKKNWSRLTILPMSSAMALKGQVWLVEFVWRNFGESYKDRKLKLKTYTPQESLFARHTQRWNRIEYSKNISIRPRHGKFTHDSSNHQQNHNNIYSKRAWVKTVWQFKANYSKAKCTRLSVQNVQHENVQLGSTKTNEQHVKACHLKVIKQRACPSMKG